MEYLLLIAFQLIGIGFHVMQKIIKLDDDHVGINRKQVFKIFFDEDWDTLVVSALILLSHLLVHYVIDTYTPDFRAVNYYILYSFGAALMLGYLGQRWVYKVLGSAEKKIDILVGDKFK
jgi:hypothetical protein